MIRTEFGRGYRFTGVLRTNVILELCEPSGQNGGLAEIFSDIAVGIRSNAVSIR